jgi:mono/diheme cytochrome c family protein
MSLGFNLQVPLKSPDASPPPEPNAESPLTRAAFFVIAAFVGVAVLAVIVLRPKPGPPPEEIASDPLLSKGHELYAMRCVSCHGVSGRGDGPIAASVGTPKPGDLTDERWTHGDRPDQVISVIAKGIPGTSMAAWDSAFDAEEIRALAAYVYHLAGQVVPGAIRSDGGSP